MNEINRKISPGQGCPICGRPMETAFKPFCSKRCADIDLGRWLKGNYVIPGRETDEGEGQQTPSAPDDPSA
jgi:endogenous inhibitor of DNA gyrase (YacG/DUF329 family)